MELLLSARQGSKCFPVHYVIRSCKQLADGYYYYSYFAHEETEAQVIHSSKIKTRICRSDFPDPSRWTHARAHPMPCRGAQETKAAGPTGWRRPAGSQAAPAVTPRAGPSTEPLIQRRPGRVPSVRGAEECLESGAHGPQT